MCVLTLASQPADGTLCGQNKVRRKIKEIVFNFYNRF
jgi:hypothetical protein